MPHKREYVVLVVMMGTGKTAWPRGENTFVRSFDVDSRHNWSARHFGDLRRDFGDRFIFFGHDGDRRWLLVVGSEIDCLSPQRAVNAFNYARIGLLTSV